MKTPYENHTELKHKTSFISHDGINKVEECTECLARFLWYHDSGSPTTLYAHVFNSNGDI